MASARSSAPRGPNWKGLLIKNPRGNYVAHAANVTIAFTHDPAWKDLLQFNEFVGDITATRPPPWPKDMMPAAHCKPGDWTYRDTIRAAEWLARTHEVICHTATVGEGLHVAADRKSIHPVRDWLRGLKWDRRERIDTFLIRLAGATDSAYVRAVSKNFLIGAVARIMRPGCQVDTMPVFEGEQGIGKTSLLRILGGEWFMSTTIDPGDKDSYQILRGKWIVEFGELDALTRAEITRVKQYITQTIDRYRPSYGKMAEDFARQAVFVGTVNPEGGGYLKDTTGARRFQPVELRAKKGATTIDLAGLAKERSQLWAEALVRFSAGEHWHLTDAEELRAAAEEAEERRQQDPWEAIIGGWLTKRNSVERAQGIEIHFVLENVLGLEVGKMNRADEMRCAAVLRLCGWGDSRKVKVGGFVGRRFFPNLKLSSVPKESTKEEPREASSGTFDKLNGKRVENAQNAHKRLPPRGSRLPPQGGSKRGGGNLENDPRRRP